jgi:hypothetical protein
MWALNAGNLAIRSEKSRTIWGMDLYKAVGNDAKIRIPQFLRIQTAVP